MNDLATVSTRSGPVGVTLLDVTGELDISTMPLFAESIERALALPQPQIGINMSRVSYIDSSALGVLVAAVKQTQRSGGQLVLISPTRTVRRVLEITQLTLVLPIFESEDSAVDALSPAAAPEPKSRSGSGRVSKGPRITMQSHAISRP